MKPLFTAPASLLLASTAAHALSDIEYDGLTTVLTASATGLPLTGDTARFFITDEGDEVYDSVVFIQAGSFSTDPDPNQGPGPGPDPVPAPAALALFGLGVAALGAARPAPGPLTACLYPQAR